MTELTFLLELLFSHKLPKATCEVIVSRIKEVGMSLPQQRQAPQAHYQPPGPPQAPSMQAIMARNPDLVAVPQPVAVVAQTPATTAAMASRQQAIAESMAGKVDKTTGRPRKF